MADDSTQVASAGAADVDAASAGAEWHMHTVAESAAVGIADGIGLVISAVLALVLIRYGYGRSSRSSSEIENVPGPKSPSWLKGNFEQVFNPAAWDFHTSLTQQYGSTVRLHGPFGSKSLYTCDPNAMHSVLVKDQDVFEENDGFIKSNRVIFGNGLLGTLGHYHRKQRRILNPVFSTAHLRDMAPTFFDVAHKLRNALKAQLEAKSKSQEVSIPYPQQDAVWNQNRYIKVDILSWMTRTALEIIGQAGMGYSFDPLSNTASTPLYPKMIKDLLPALRRVQFLYTNVLPLASEIGSPSFRRFVVNLLAPFWNNVRHVRDMVDYMHTVANGIYESKKQAFERGEEAAARQLGRGKDLISILMEENLDASNGDRLEESEVISQSSFSQINTLIFAAMDTTSNAMARILHLLSKHPDVQDKLRDELNGAKIQRGKQDLSYDDLVSLPYLDAVCRETLLSSVTRIACQDAIIPLSTALTGLNGERINEIAVPKDKTLMQPPPDADEWKPERWLSPLPTTVTDARIPGVYSHLMTFIGGRRSCIGFKFSEMEIKVVVSVLVESFKFSPSAHDPEIFWQMNGITAPVVGNDQHPQLPIIIIPVN
ncbi:hypothetical protein GYMLUDRAFT_239459 [Collybiopsis luxurians FD-317 M1]|nr:hypothetical protein GYMLUDRAFT_239459 [Collybiopsis luxurians FD-317 M1]